MHSGSRTRPPGSQCLEHPGNRVQVTDVGQDRSGVGGAEADGLQPSGAERYHILEVLEHRIYERVLAGVNVMALFTVYETEMLMCGALTIMVLLPAHGRSQFSLSVILLRYAFTYQRSSRRAATVCHEYVMANANHQLARHSFSMETAEWGQFATAVKATSPELTRSMALRELIRWWMGSN